MRRIIRWLAFTAILIAIPMGVLRLVQPGGDGTPEEQSIEPEAATVGLEAAHTASNPEAPTGTAADPVEAQAKNEAPRAAGDGPRFEPVIVENLTASDLHAMKESYSCDLALTARRDCDAAYEDLDAHDMCLSLRQYYSYSRHCGYQP